MLTEVIVEELVEVLGLGAGSYRSKLIVLRL